MGTTLSLHGERRTPRMDWLNIIRNCHRLVDWALDSPVDETTNDRVEQRREDQAKESHAEHTGENGDAHHAPHLSAGATGDDERDDARDERKRGHQDWPQTNARRFQRGGEVIATLSLEIARKLHDQNRILTRESDE